MVDHYFPEMDLRWLLSSSTPLSIFYGQKENKWRWWWGSPLNFYLDHNRSGRRMPLLPFPYFLIFLCKKVLTGSDRESKPFVSSFFSLELIESQRDVTSLFILFIGCDKVSKGYHFSLSPFLWKWQRVKKMLLLPFFPSFSSLSLFLLPFIFFNHSNGGHFAAFGHFYQ